MKKITILLFTTIMIMSGLQVKNGQIQFSLNSAMASTEVNFKNCKVTAKTVLRSCLVNAKLDFNIANLLCNRHPSKAKCIQQNRKSLQSDKRACRSNYNIVMGLCKALKE